MQQKKKNINSVKVAERSNCKKWISTGCTKRKINGNDPTLPSSLSLLCLYILKLIYGEYGENWITLMALEEE